jgi:segregation and condensation protein A
LLDTTINVKTDHFDGPLALLLLLVQKEEMNIRELDLTKITKQYLAYISQMRDLNFDVAGDYLYLAATLLLLKSNFCITESEQENLQEKFDGSESLNITSQSELIRRLEELEKFQRLSKLMWNLPKKGHEIFVKPKVNRKEIVNSILMPMDLEKLLDAMMDFLIKEKRKYVVLRRDKLSIKEKLVFLKEHLCVGQKTTLGDLIDSNGGDNIDNVVITFISLLELARLKKIKIFQNETLGSVYVDVTDSLDNFDVTTADGFDEEGEDGAAPVEAEQMQEAPVPMMTSDETMPTDQVLQ